MKGHFSHTKGNSTIPKKQSRVICLIWKWLPICQTRKPILKVEASIPNNSTKFLKHGACENWQTLYEHVITRQIEFWNCFSIKALQTQMYVYTSTMWFLESRKNTHWLSNLGIYSHTHWFSKIQRTGFGILLWL